MVATQEYSEKYLQGSRQSAVVGVTILYIVLEVIALILRQISKRLARIRLGWDDLLIGLGLILCMALNACSLADVYWGGVGLHEAWVLQTDPGAMVVWGHMIIIVPIVYTSAVIPAKLAVLHLYLHIFTDKKLRIACYVVIAIILGNWLACTLAGFLACRPISYFWTQEGTCFDIDAFFRWSGLPNILTDLVMLVLPIPMVYHLQISLRLKLGIAFTFLLGSVGLVSSIIRFYEFYVTNAEIDGTWNASQFVIWCVAEAGTYQVAACLPLFRPLVKLLGGKLKSSKQNSSNDSNSHLSNSNPQSSRALDMRKSGGRFHSFKGGNISIDEEDGLGLVSLGDHRSDVPLKAIRVDHQFTVT